MGNLKKLLSNKNVVTLLGAVLIVVVLFLFYRWRVNSATQPVELPYAIKAIEQGAQITPENVGIVEVPQQKLKGNVITNVSSVYNKYAYCYIPSGSLFFSTSKDNGTGGNIVDTRATTADYLKYDLPEGLTSIQFDVTTESTYGNSFFPKKYFDIYLRIHKDSETDIVTFGRFINNVRILAVRAGGLDVFASTNEVRQPSKLIVGLTDEQIAYLRAAEKMADVEMILVPTAVDLKNPDSEVPAPKIINTGLKEYLEPYIVDLTSTEPISINNQNTNPEVSNDNGNSASPEVTE